ncbi:phage protein Gp37 [Variovorax atrisoli]|uniref:phage protein Gp37 n=1 Tax=Variovorax atrisoli TaxID=3394203 RepID=UPI003394A998
MTSPIQQIEQAMLARLRTVSRPYAGLTIESYGAQLDDELFGWVRTVPAAWVTFDKVTESTRISRRRFRLTGNFEVLSAQRSLGENDGRMGGPLEARDVGVYQLIEDNKLALANQKLGLAIQPLTPGAIRSVMKGMAQRDAMAIYAQAFSTTWVEEIPDDNSGNDDLLRIGLNYLIKPGDEEVDTSDLITLRS